MESFDAFYFSIVVISKYPGRMNMSLFKLARSFEEMTKIEKKSQMAPSAGDSVSSFRKIEAQVKRMEQLTLAAVNGNPGAEDLAALHRGLASWAETMITAIHIPHIQNLAMRTLKALLQYPNCKKLATEFNSLISQMSQEVAVVNSVHNQSLPASTAIPTINVHDLPNAPRPQQMAARPATKKPAAPNMKQDINNLLNDHQAPVGPNPSASVPNTKSRFT